MEHKQRKKPLTLRIIKLLNGGLDFVVVFVLLVSMIFGFYALWDSHQMVKAAVSDNYTIYRPGPDTPTFQELQKMNPDVCGWITVYGTTIDYPVVQGEDNWEYINKDATGAYSMTGAIFMDCKNNRDFSDFNTILYGHNMTPQVMFGNIRDFSKKEHFDSRKYGEVYYDGKMHGIAFYAFLQDIDASDWDIYAPGVTGQMEQEAYLNLLTERAVYTRPMDVSAGDQIILLSSCSSMTTNGRNILVGKVTDELYPNTFGGPPYRGKKTLDPWTIWEMLPLWAWIVIAIVLLLVVILILHWLIRRMRRRENRKE